MTQCSTDISWLQAFLMCNIPVQLLQTTRAHPVLWQRLPCSLCAIDGSSLWPVPYKQPWGARYMHYQWYQSFYTWYRLLGLYKTLISPDSVYIRTSILNTSSWCSIIIRHGYLLYLPRKVCQISDGICVWSS